MEETRNEWFVYGTYTPAGRPIMEDRLMEKAKTMLLYCIIDFADFANAVMELNRQQDILIAARQHEARLDKMLEEFVAPNLFSE